MFLNGFTFSTIQLSMSQNPDIIGISTITSIIVTETFDTPYITISDYNNRNSACTHKSKNS